MSKKCIVLSGKKGYKGKCFPVFIKQKKRLTFWGNLHLKYKKINYACFTFTALSPFLPSTIT